MTWNGSAHPFLVVALSLVVVDSMAMRAAHVALHDVQAYVDSMPSVRQASLLAFERNDVWLDHVSLLLATSVRLRVVTYAAARHGPHGTERSSCMAV